MNFHNNEVWIGVEDLIKDESLVNIANQEFLSAPISEVMANDGAMSTQANRRDFLKYLGFGVGAATIAASCEIPMKRAIPYVKKPDSVVPGVASYFASSFVNGGDYCAILVKTREGRPIKIEGNDLSSVSKGGTSARAQATVLSLYDANRYQFPGTPDKEGKLKEVKWADLDAAVKGKLGAGAIRIVTNSILSPTTKKVLADFTAKYPNTKVVSYDPVSASGILDANESSFGMRVVPNYKFDNAKVIVSFGADFLGTWISPLEYAADYAKNRRVDNTGSKMSRHIQVESYMSMTGSNADNRILVKPSEMGNAIAYLYGAITGAASGAKVNAKAEAALKKAAAELLANKGTSLVVAGSNNPAEQVLVNAINSALGNYGTSIDFSEYTNTRQGNDRDVQALVTEMNSGAVGTLIVMGANPIFELPNGAAFATAMAKVPSKVSFATVRDETSAACNYVAPNNHTLESWGDAEPKRGYFSLIQPTIAPLFKTRQAEESLLRWMDHPVTTTTTDTPYYEYLKTNWVAAHKAGSGFASDQGFWENSLHSGVFESKAAASNPSMNAAAVATALSGVSKPGTGLEISFYEHINMGNGQYAGNPWLMEMPDPVLRTVWGNYLSVPVKFDGVNDFQGFNDLQDGDIVELTIGGKVYKDVVVMRQFGQMEGTVAIGLGYGRSIGSTCATGVGTNVNASIGLAAGLPQYYATDVKVSAKVGADADFACVQYHHTMGVTAMGKEEGKIINADEKSLGYKGFQGSLVNRSVIRRADIKEVGTFVKQLKETRAEIQHLNSKTLYDGHEDKYTRGHHWNMHVDLNACIGCGACTVACMAENNVPVVGKKEVHRHHEMTWLRIDRYYYGDAENPNVVYQPMMCQHCDNAPCENVCPVNATNHSGEGLNQMTYNRCIGTRYCANNCPYKVRRFNWLDYTTADLFGYNENYLNDPKMNTDSGIPMYADNLLRMVLNPDVTVRTRGVIEKCSFCVQRIQEGKLTAKREERRLVDTDVKTACQTACPTGAIVFGDRNNPEGIVSQKLKNEINYLVLEEVNVASNVTYTAKFINKEKMG